MSQNLLKLVHIKNPYQGIFHSRGGRCKPAVLDQGKITDQTAFTKQPKNHLVIPESGTFGQLYFSPVNKSHEQAWLVLAPDNLSGLNMTDLQEWKKADQTIISQKSERKAVRPGFTGLGQKIPASRGLLPLS
jgi:hypothetical protein